MKSLKVIRLLVPVVIIYLFCVLINPVIPFDNAHHAVIPCSVKNKTGSGPGCWTPEASDVEKADKIIIDFIAHKSQNPDLMNDITKKGFGNYFRQYTGIFGDKGEKLVRIYYMCVLPASNTDWKRNIIMINGGGHCYFNAVVDLALMKCEKFHVNSPR